MPILARITALCALAGAALAAIAVQQAAGAAERGDAPPVPLAELRDFSSIAAAGPDDVLVTHGARYAVQVEGDPRAIERLDIYVEDNVLHVERKRRRGEGWSEHDKGATIRVTLPALRHAVLAGSGNMRIDEMGGEKIEAIVSGSGNLSIARIDARVARLALAGSGNLSARGKAGSADVSIAGSGDVLAEQLASETASISIAGSGNASVGASRQARVSILGSGDATVKGTTNCQVSRLGSGTMRCSA